MKQHPRARGLRLRHQGVSYGDPQFALVEIARSLSLGGGGECPIFLGMCPTFPVIGHGGEERVKMRIPSGYILKPSICAVKITGSCSICIKIRISEYHSGNSNSKRSKSRSICKLFNSTLQLSHFVSQNKMKVHDAPSVFPFEY